MASSSSQDHTAKRARLQEETEKRIAVEQLKEKAKSKRQKKMFATRKVIGPHDIFVDSNLPKIKLEQDDACSTTVKQELLENNLTVDEQHDFLVSSTLLDVKPEVGANSVEQDEIEEALELKSTIPEETNEHSEQAEQRLNLNNETNVKDNLLSYVQEHNDDLTDVQEADRDDSQVCVLKKQIKKLEMLLQNLDINFHTTELGNRNNKLSGSVAKLCDSTFKTVLDNELVATKVPADQQEKTVEINFLSLKILELRYKLYENLPERHLKKVLPILYPEFKLNHTYDNRSACDNWKTAANMFVTEMENIPTWNIPPLQILARTYKFTDLSQLDIYNKKRNPNISNSTVWLDNISIDCRDSVKVLKLFFSLFGSKIKYFKIRQFLDLNVHFMDTKAEQLMDFVKFCLEWLPNLEGFTFVITTGSDKTKGANHWKHALKDQTETNEYWHGYTFPKLENLESIVINFENFSRFTFLKCLASNLIGSYSDQLKQLSILALASENSLWNIEFLVASNLLELTIRQSLLAQVELNCTSVKKCKILDHANVLTHDNLILIQAVFPKVVCLGFNFDYWRPGFHESLWTTYTPKLPNILTLELENCRSVTFTLLTCFPNLRYLKLISLSSNTLTDSQDDDTVLYIRKLFQNENLYNKRLFWEHFPNISLVTLEFNESSGSEPEKMLAPKLYTYTRNGYVQYWENNLQESE